MFRVKTKYTFLISTLLFAILIGFVFRACSRGQGTNRYEAGEGLFIRLSYVSELILLDHPQSK